MSAVTVTEMPEVQETNWLAESQIYFLGIITCVGVITNSLSFRLMVGKRFRKTTVGVYIGTLAIFDNLSLVVIFVLALEIEPLSYITSAYSDALCKILNVGAYVCIPVSAYVIAVLSCERCYVTMHPYRPKPTYKHALICVSVVIALISMSYSPIAIVMYGLSPVQSVLTEMTTQNPGLFQTNNSNSESAVQSKLSGTEFVCNPLPQHQFNVDNYVVVIDLIVANIIPYITITVANILLIIKMVKSRSQLHPQAFNQQMNALQAKNKKERRVTRMLITASLFYLITTLPLSLYVCIVSITLGTFNDPIWVVLLDLYVLNFSLNFFVYVISGQTFRAEFKKLLRIQPHETSVGY